MIKLLFIFFSFYSLKAIANTNKNAVFVIIGAGGRVDQEIPEYAKQLKNKGYSIVIHSFDAYYTEHSEDALLGIPQNIESLENGLANEKLEFINYTVYDSIAKDFIMAHKNSIKNNIHLFRYATKVWKNNRTESYIKKIIKEAVDNNKIAVLIDSIHCGKIQPITLYLFEKYKNNIIVLHSLFDKVQVIDKNFIERTKDIECLHDAKYVKFTSVENYRAFLFDNMKRIFAQLQENNKFEDLPPADKQIFVNSINNLKNNLDAIGDYNMKNCINDSLQKSKFNLVDEKVVNEYYEKNK